MKYRNQEAHNDPDWSRPSPAVVEQAKQVLTPKQYKPSRFVEWITYAIGLSVGLSIWFYFSSDHVFAVAHKLISGDWHWRWQS